MCSDPEALIFIFHFESDLSPFGSGLTGIYSGPLLINPGKFSLPPTRVEAMYAPETFGELPNAAVEVAP